MRENCTYGSMRGRAYPITRGVPLYSTPQNRGGEAVSECPRPESRLAHESTFVGLA